MDEDEADELDDPELPDQADMDESDELELIQCPHCGKYINEEAERCHHCGQYISAEDVSRKIPVWLIAGVVLAVLAAATWVLIFRIQ
jgi:uncharacterized protein (DUF983 family)